MTVERGQQQFLLIAARTTRGLEDKFKVYVVEDQAMNGQIGGQIGGALYKKLAKTAVSCTVANCQFKMEQLDEIAAKRVLENHMLVVHRPTCSRGWVRVRETVQRPSTPSPLWVILTPSWPWGGVSSSPPWGGTSATSSPPW